MDKDGMSYYDIDSILGDDQLVGCNFAVTAYDLGFLDSSNTEGGRDLDEGARVELPMWLVQELAMREYVQVELPISYGPRFRSQLLADPLAVNLRDCSPFFYEIGVSLSKHLRERLAAPIVPMLVRALAVRYREILARAQNSRNDDVTEFVESLTVVERRLFDAGYGSSDEHFRWKTRDGELLTSARPIKRRKSCA